MNLNERMFKMMKGLNGLKRVASETNEIEGKVGKLINKEKVILFEVDFEPSDRSVGLDSNMIYFTITAKGSSNVGEDLVKEIHEKEKELKESSHLKEVVAKFILEHKDENKEVEKFVYDSDMDDDGKVTHYVLSQDYLAKTMYFDRIEAEMGDIESEDVIITIDGYC